jgi:protein gp37
MYREQTWRGNDPMLVRRTKTLNDPLKWDRGFVFTCSYSDFFIDEADDWRDEAWDIIRRTPNLIYQILTKRIERVKECLPVDWPLPNVWLGVSAENQAMADKRIPILLQIPAAVRFVSVEPMLEKIDLLKSVGEPDDEDWDFVNYMQDANDDIEPEEFIEECEEECDWVNYGTQLVHSSEHIEWLARRKYRVRLQKLSRSINWVICGCESGPGERPLEQDWAMDLRDQCQGAGVPFFLKQMMLNGKLVKMPELDGEVWDEMPGAAHV